MSDESDDYDGIVAYNDLLYGRSAGTGIEGDFMERASQSAGGDFMDIVAMLSIFFLSPRYENF